MIFTSAEIDEFCRNSGDTNPLHSDASFAKMNGFDDRVVPGMLAVSKMLGDRQPKTLRAKFVEPLYPNVEYPECFKLESNRLWIGGNQKKTIIWLDGAVRCAQEVFGPITGAFGSSFNSFRSHVFNWVSWFVGTQHPGHGAVLSNVEIYFHDQSNESINSVDYSAMTQENRDIGVMVIDAMLIARNCMATCQITAFLPRKP